MLLEVVEGMKLQRSLTPLLEYQPGIPAELLIQPSSLTRNPIPIPFSVDSYRMTGFMG